MLEYASCDITFNILKKQFNNGDIIKSFDSEETFEISRINYLSLDGHAFTKCYKGVKVYDGKTGQLAKKVGFGIDSDKQHMEHTRRFVNGWKDSGLSTPREYLDSTIRERL